MLTFLPVVHHGMGLHAWDVSAESLSHHLLVSFHLHYTSSPPCHSGLLTPEVALYRLYPLLPGRIFHKSLPTTTHRPRIYCPERRLHSHLHLHRHPICRLHRHRGLENHYLHTYTGILGTKRPWEML